MDRDEIIEIVEKVIAFNENHKNLDGLFIKMEFSRDAMCLWLKANIYFTLAVVFSDTAAFEVAAADLEKWAKEKSR